MKHSDVPDLVKEEIERAFMESGASNLSYLSLVPRIKTCLLPIKNFLDASIIGFISCEALMNPEYDEVEVDGELHIQKK